MQFSVSITRFCGVRTLIDSFNKIGIASLHGNYSAALQTPARTKKLCLQIAIIISALSRGQAHIPKEAARSFQALRTTAENVCSGIGKGEELDSCSRSQS